MPIQAACPACGYEHNLADRLAGQTVKCKDCGKAFLVKAARPAKGSPGIKEKGKGPPPLPSRSRDNDPDDVPRPRKKAARYEEDEDDRPRRKRRNDEDDRRRGSALPWIIGAGAAAGVAVIAVVLILVLNSGSDNKARNDEPLAQNKPPINFNNDKKLEFPNPNNDQGNKDFPKKERPKKERPKIDFPKKDPELPPVPWAVQADPGPDMTKAPANPKGTLSLIGLPHFVYPSTPSPFVAVRHGQIGKEGWQIIDLQTFKQAAVINGKPDLDKEALSPDGKFLAGKGKFRVNATTINVFSLGEGRITQAIELDTKAASLSMIDFLEDGHLITYKTHGLTGHYQVFNIASGKEVQHFTVEGLLDRKSNLALSPGRKYLAVAHKNQIDIFQPVTGKQAGQIRLPIGSGQFKALAFSPDGKELACLLFNFGSSSRLLSFNLADGKLAVDHKFEKDVGTLVKNAFGYQGQVMEWVPDGSGWLLFGQIWIDHASGAPVYNVPVDPKDFRNWPRRLIGKDHVVVAGGDFRVQGMQILALPKDQIAAEVKKARAGGGQAPAEMPALKAADLAKAKMLSAPNGNVAWKVEPDPAPSNKALQSARPIALKNKADDIILIRFSAAPAQAVVFSKLTPNPLAKRRVYRAERYDLAGGKFLGGFDLFASDQAKQPPFGFPQATSNFQADVSPDGSRLIARPRDKTGRLDIWETADGKHLAGWQPSADGKIDWFAFLDQERVLTSGGGKLILWKVPECQAIYVAEGYSGAIALSPSRKYVLAVAGGAMEILDAASGDRCGQLAAPGGPVPMMNAAAFRADGKELAVAMPDRMGGKIGRWNLATGASLGLADVNHNAARSLEWAGPTHVLYGDTLIDWNLKGPLWHYTLPGKGAHATGSPDGRHWFAYTLKTTAYLAAQKLPDSRAAALATVVAAGNAKPVVTPGMSVQYVVNSGSADFNSKVQSGGHANVQSRGFKVGPGGLTVSVSAQEGATGRLLDYEIRTIKGIGLPQRKIVKISERKIDCALLITDSQGAAIAKHNITFATPDSLNFQGDDYDRQLTQSMWNNAQSWASTFGLPTNVYRINGQLQSLPQSGALGGP